MRGRVHILWYVAIAAVLVVAYTAIVGAQEGEQEPADSGFGFLSDAAIVQGTPGYYGQDVSERWAYIANGDRKIYTGADTVDAFITETTATQGAATVYVVIQRLK